jgi:hypothetical protein
MRRADRCGRISIYNRNCKQDRSPNYCFYISDAATYIKNVPETSTFTKVLIYAGFQYFSKDDAALTLKYLHRRFLGLTKVFIGNVPNKQYADRFYKDRNPTAAELNDHEARIGAWYLPDEIEAMARAAGWRTSISYMPADYFVADHRFDVTLERSDI